MKTVRRPPYPKWNPGYFPCSSLTPLPLSSRRPSVSFGGFGLRSGAVAYVVKSAGAEELKKAIRVAVAGGRYVTSPFPEAFIEGPPARTDQEPTDPHETLTLREREVLYLVAEGLSNRQIADRLEISSRTVEAHRARLMTKLRLDSQAALIRYALERTDRLNP